MREYDNSDYSLTLLTCVHQSSLGLVYSGVIDVVEDRDDDLQHVAALENVIEELPVMLAQLPEQDQELLVEMNLIIERQINETVDDR